MQRMKCWMGSVTKYFHLSTTAVPSCLVVSLPPARLPHSLSPYTVSSSPILTNLVRGISLVCDCRCLNLDQTESKFQTWNIYRVGAIKRQFVTLSTEWRCLLLLLTVVFLRSWSSTVEGCEWMNERKMLGMELEWWLQKERRGKGELKGARSQGQVVSDHNQGKDRLKTGSQFTGSISIETTFYYPVIICVLSFLRILHPSLLLLSLSLDSDGRRGPLLWPPTHHDSHHYFIENSQKRPKEEEELRRNSPTKCYPHRGGSCTFIELQRNLFQRRKKSMICSKGKIKLLGEGRVLNLFISFLSISIVNSSIAII